jgi:hypothetical protein
MPKVLKCRKETEPQGDINTKEIRESEKMASRSPRAVAFRFEDLLVNVDVPCCVAAEKTARSMPPNRCR